ncbi:RING finger protein 10 [Strongylocentrotus purpuratus]|uniref:E3 ubiquitin-protein ligase RNF10 n=1 Tax=Strongylocentrotus purpuratus TaxID=7668 RepID=A0A7M7T1V8_STRPU|nr:RING finger protein 10 [Strongylocentrotus purpuratus]
MDKENNDMEKKITSSPARLTSCETKGKENGRSQRSNKNRREPPQVRAPGDPNNSQSRRPVPQKSRAVDKRPRSRGLPASRRDEVTVTQRAEFGSALPHGPKKLNMNHLLNFTFAARESEDARGGSGYRSRSRWGHRRFNKEQFLQANCQFVVKAKGNYKQQSVDPDALVEWDSIEQIRMLGHEMPSCPICLYPPTAAKITKCGHIYCWPCILHYISLGEKRWRKCPICYESVMASDLKSVVAKSLKTFSVGDTITMRLMTREKGSITIHPHFPDSAPVELPVSPCMTDSSEETCFVKLMIASPREVLDEILKRERGELEKQLKEAVDEFEKSFVQRAMDSLKEREDGLGLDKAVTEPSTLVTDEKRPSLDQKGDDNDMMMTTPILPKGDCIVYASAFSDEEQDETIEEPSSPPGDDQPPPQEPSSTDVTKEPKETEDGTDDVLEESNSSKATGNPSPQEDVGAPVSGKTGEGEEKKEELGGGGEKEKEGVDYIEMSPSHADSASGRERKIPPSHSRNVFFYQAEDGQQLFLGSLNARCLMHEYGHLEHSPLTITAKIVEIEHISVTQEMRNRMRHLQHLPLTCDVSVCELALRPPTLSPRTLAYFSAEIQRKKQKRDKKAREEKRRERKISQEEDRKNGIYPTARYSLKSTNQFPSFSPGSVPENPGLPRPISPASVDSGASSNYSAVLSDNHDDDFIFSSTYAEGEFVSSPVDVSMSLPGGGATGGGGAGGWPSLSSPDSQGGGHRSFAQMLRDGAAKPSSPMKSSSNPASASPQHYTTASYGRTPGRELTSSNDSDNEDYVPVPQYKDAFSNAIQTALDKAAASMSIKKGDEADGDAGKGGGGGRKNKKGRKKQLLFSTAGPRFK